MIMELSQRLSKDPYVLFVWVTVEEFSGELGGLAIREPGKWESYYLVDVMRKHCKGEGRAWAILADECSAARDEFLVAKVLLGHSVGLDGHMEADVFDD